MCFAQKSSEVLTQTSELMAETSEVLTEAFEVLTETSELLKITKNPMEKTPYKRVISPLDVTFSCVNTFNLILNKIKIRKTLASIYQIKKANLP